MTTRPRGALAVLVFVLGPCGTPALAAEPCTVSRECVERLGRGNVCDAEQCQPYVDRSDLFDVLGLSAKEEPKPEPFKLYPAIIPAIGYNPALGFLIGAVGTLGMYLGKPEETTMSSATALALITTNKQLVLQLTSTLMTSRNDWQLQGDWRFLLYNQDTYGLGTGTPPVQSGFSIGGWGDTEPIPGAQPMKFNLLRLHQAALKQVIPNLYLGGSIRYDRYYGIVDESLNLSVTPPVVTSHYAYSVVYGFDPAAYSLSGVTVDALYDSRDSTINAYRGLYAHASFGLFPTWLGSSQTSTRVAGELRAYVGLSDAVPRNVLAFWLLAAGVTSGHQPYLTLQSLGWDAKGTTGRGYVQGRFRGTSEVYAEAEWRFRITDNGFLGGALFANAVTMSRPAVNLPAYDYSLPAENLFSSVKPAAGVGLRFLMNKEARTNIRLDFAVGVDSFAIYFGAGEVF
jgi:hypothetical protein